MSTPTAERRGPPRLRSGTWGESETDRPLVGSGLQIASDFPILAVYRTAFSRAACAGYDCLANKGAVMVRLRVGETTVDVVDTHLNSRGASGVSVARADRAYAAQVAALARFVRAHHHPANPLVLGGDFNIGTVPARRHALAQALASAARRDALHDAARQGLPLSADARETLAHAKDWEFLSPGARTGIAVAAIEVPFGRDHNGQMLSDHIGYVAKLTLHPAPGRGP